MNSKHDNLRNLKACLNRCALTLNIRMKRDLEDLFIGSGEVGSSDEPWNITNMNRTGHTYWGKAYFGLQWVGVCGEKLGIDPISKEQVTYTVFNVMFHWLSPRIRKAIESHLRYPSGVKLEPKQLVRLDTRQDLRSLTDLLGDAFNEPHPRYSTKPAVLRDQHGRLIETGRIFEMRVDQRDLHKMKAVIDAQWLAIQMAAFSGAGEVADDLDRECPPDYYLVMMLGGGTLRDEAGLPPVRSDGGE
jgi:hypothetical protein